MNFVSSFAQLLYGNSIYTKYVLMNGQRLSLVQNFFGTGRVASLPVCRFLPMVAALWL
jgi:hypothetical protein